MVRSRPREIAGRQRCVQLARLDAAALEKIAGGRSMKCVCFWEKWSPALSEIDDTISVFCAVVLSQLKIFSLTESFAVVIY